MRYIFIFSAILVVLIQARENPFKPIVDTSATVQVLNKKEVKKSFVSTKVKLPSSARVLKSVEFHFQNLDGSMDSKNIEIDKRVDWHDELIVKKLGSVKSLPNTTVLATPKKNSSKAKEINFKDIIHFTISDNSIHLKTVDRKIRDFLVKKPYKIVVDFEREVSFFTKVYNLDMRYFNSITLGKHSGYYRVAIELDGRYLYDRQKVKDGYLFTLR
jgi:hypothetical protein